MITDEKKYRLVTRSDMDGLVCAILLKHLNMISEITFVHPKDVQDGKVLLTENDITTNLPYNGNVHISFDHHASEVIRISGSKANRIIEPNAPSTARVVYNYFGGKEVFPSISEDMMAAVDKNDSAEYTMEDVLSPKNWELLSFLMDARTGLGRFRDFRISNYDLMMKLIDYCQDHGIQDILNLPDVKERVDLYFSYQDRVKEQIQRCTAIYKNLAVLDLRDEEIIFPGNRFLIYALFPVADISIHVLWGKQKQNIVFAVGKSIFNRASTVNIGKLMLEFAGGGHEDAGTCQIPVEKAEDVRKELIKRLQK